MRIYFNCKIRNVKEESDNLIMVRFSTSNKHKSRQKLGSLEIIWVQTFKNMTNSIGGRTIFVIWCSMN